MKVARIAFNRTVLFSALGFDTETFKELLDQLPKNSKIVGFGGDYNLLLDYIFIHNDLFVDTPDGSTPPEIRVSFMRRFDGTSFCSGVDCKDALAQSVTLSIPSPSGAVSANLLGHKIRNFCPKAPWPVTSCQYITYTGQFKVEEICKYCGDPK